jgi:hypothetical protein
MRALTLVTCTRVSGAPITALAFTPNGLNLAVGAADGGLFTCTTSPRPGVCSATRLPHAVTSLCWAAGTAVRPPLAGAPCAP